MFVYSNITDLWFTITRACTHAGNITITTSSSADPITAALTSTNNNNSSGSEGSSQSTTTVVIAVSVLLTIAVIAIIAIVVIRARSQRSTRRSTNKSVTPVEFDASVGGIVGPDSFRGADVTKTTRTSAQHENPRYACSSLTTHTQCRFWLHPSISARPAPLLCVITIGHDERAALDLSLSTHVPFTSCLVHRMRIKKEHPHPLPF